MRLGTKGGTITKAFLSVVCTPAAPSILPQKCSQFCPNQLSTLIKISCAGLWTSSTPPTHDCTSPTKAELSSSRQMILTVIADRCYHHLPFGVPCRPSAAKRGYRKVAQTIFLLFSESLAQRLWTI